MWIFFFFFFFCSTVNSVCSRVDSDSIRGVIVDCWLHVVFDCDESIVGKSLLVNNNSQSCDFLCVSINDGVSWVEGFLFHSFNWLEDNVVNENRSSSSLEEIDDNSYKSNGIRLTQREWNSNFFFFLYVEVEKIYWGEFINCLLSQWIFVTKFVCSSILNVHDENPMRKI